MTPKYRYGLNWGPPTAEFPKLTLTSYPELSPFKSLITTGFLPTIWDQSSTSSCTGHGTTRGKMYVRAKQGLPFVDMSRLFPYWNARVVEGTQSSDSGAIIADVVQASQQFGDCPYTDLPTDPSLVTVQPSTQAFSDAMVDRTLTATRVWGATSEGLQYHFKHCIDVLGLPVVFGVVVYESFESNTAIQSGIIPIPNPGAEQYLGGHCITGVAYDDSSQLVTFDNSWGTSVGQAGRFQIPYAYIFNPELASDFHAIMLEAV